jgi:hypothetical protein
MDQQRIIEIVDRAGVPYDADLTFQKQYYAVRFFYNATGRSLNLGYRLTKPVFVADFVFKVRDSRDENRADLTSFLRLFGGGVGNRSTSFARLEPPYSDEQWLIDVIRAYWAMGKPLTQQKV